MEKTNNTINTKNNANNLEATQEKENIMCVCDDIVVTIPEVEKLLQNEDTKDTAMKLLAIMWKTSGEPEATKKPTVQEELTKENDILENIKKINRVEAILIHNRLDLICPYKGAYDLHKGLPKSKLITVPDFGHVGKKLHKTIKKEIKNILK